MNDYTRTEVAMFLGYNLGLFVLVGVTAYVVSPYALLGLVFVGSAYERATVERDGITVSVTASEVTEADLVRLLYETEEYDDKHNDTA